jgi:hypothetical protein
VRAADQPPISFHLAANRMGARQLPVFHAGPSESFASVEQHQNTSFR